MRRTIISVLVSGSIVLTGCGEESVCHNDIKTEICPLLIDTIDNIDKSIQKVSGGTAGLSIRGNDPMNPLTGRAVQGTTQAELGTLTVAGINDYSMSFPAHLSRSFHIGKVGVKVHDKFGRIASKEISLFLALKYKQDLVYTQTGVADDNAAANLLLIFDNTIYAGMYGKSISSGNRSFQVRRYISKSNMIQEDLTKGYFGDRELGFPLLSMSQSKVYYASPGLDLRVAECSFEPGQAIQLKNCNPAIFQLPVGTSAMSVTPDGTRMVLSDTAGMLSWVKLPTGAMTSWSGVGTMDAERSTTAGVRLAVTDLNGDKLADLIAVWLSSGQQQVRAFLATTDGFAKNDALSMQLSAAIGQTSITALAAADVDNDGFGDVVIAQDQKLTVLQSQFDGFVPAWSAMVAPAGTTTTINAIALGRLDATSTPDKPLDIVTASNSGYNNDNKNTLYLHAFRPQ